MKTRMYISHLKAADVNKSQIRALLFKKRFYKLVIFLIFIGTILYIIDFSTTSINLPAKLEFYTRLLKLESDNDWSADADKDSDHFFVNTVGCKMPKFNIHDSFVQQFIVKERPVKCKTPLTSSDEANLWISMDQRHLDKLFDIRNTSLLRCYYEGFHRHNDFSVDYDKNVTYFEYGHQVRVNKEFIKVACEYGDRGVIYKDFHAFPQKTKPRINDGTENDKLNVMILGLDSVSRLNLRRQMNASVHYMLDNLKGFEFLGYNKVGDNTYPNLIPVLTGFDIAELTASCLPFENSTYDECYFLWNRYAKSGYKTLFAEDITWVGLFNFFRKGFEQQPTDYFLRNILIEMEKKVANFRRGNFDLCLGGRTPLDFVLAYLQKFVKVTVDEPTFSFFWSSSMTHDFLNSPKLIDYKIRNLLKTLGQPKVAHLNKTFLVMMSDHGMRWGKFRSTYQGMMEERQPFLIMMAPDWFQAKYPLAMRNLRRNKRFLTTPFDLHETLKDLVAPDQHLTDRVIRERTKQLIENLPLPRGISLFLPVPASRTCDLAGIAEHWCTCHERRPLSNSDARVQRVARFIVKSINDQIQPFPQCHKLHLKSIAEANLGITNDVIFSKNPTNYICDITVRIQTKPGLGEFEATVRLNSDNESTLTGSISRTNLYGKQSACINDYEKKLYCYCGS